MNFRNHSLPLTMLIGGVVVIGAAAWLFWQNRSGAAYIYNPTSNGYYIDCSSGSQKCFGTNDGVRQGFTLTTAGTFQNMTFSLNRPYFGLPDAELLSLNAYGELQSPTALAETGKGTLKLKYLNGYKTLAVLASTPIALPAGSYAIRVMLPRFSSLYEADALQVTMHPTSGTDTLSRYGSLHAGEWKLPAVYSGYGYTTALNTSLTLPQSVPGLEDLFAGGQFVVKNTPDGKRQRAAFLITPPHAGDNSQHAYTNMNWFSTMLEKSATLTKQPVDIKVVKLTDQQVINANFDAGITVLEKKAALLAEKSTSYTPLCTTDCNGIAQVFSKNNILKPNTNYAIIIEIPKTDTKTQLPLQIVSLPLRYHGYTYSGREGTYRGYDSTPAFVYGSTDGKTSGWLKGDSKYFLAKTIWQQ